VVKEISHVVVNDDDGNLERRSMWSFTRHR
jgi:hypothetical protein